MINPTIGNNSQFTAPYDILPNLLYTNPTLNNSQFTAPYDTLPNLSYTNPTVNAPQFTAPFDTLPNTTFPNPTVNTTQFTAPFNTLPDPKFLNPTSRPFSQFTAPFDTLPNPIFPNPTSNTIVTPTTYTGAPGYSGNPFDTIPAGKVFQTLTVPTYTSSFKAVNDMWSAPAAEASNITISSFAASATGFAASSVASLTGIPQVAQVANSLINLSDTTLSARYATLTFDQMRPIPGVKYADFRNRRAIGNAAALSVIRLDGAAALTSGVSARGAVFAAASANPLGGAYAVFNLNGFGFTGYGWGSQDDPYAIRNDFTLRSHVVKRWHGSKDAPTNKAWRSTINPAEVGVPFRGDRVNVIDFSQRTEKDAYKWNPMLDGKLGNTQDFIKFYFTGPKLRPGLVNTPAAENTDPNKTTTDDVMVFRATITDLTDRFNADWTPITMIGRGDKNYLYTGFDRDVQLSFKVQATDRDELQPIWRKLNALASYTAPIYNGDITLGAPWMRITIGDLFRQTPVILTSVSYTLHDTDTVWEINIEDAEYMMQVPHRVDVNCTFTIIGNELPQKGGKMYSLAKYWDNNGVAIRGNHNWLSDAAENSDAEVPKLFDKIKSERSKQQGTGG